MPLIVNPGQFRLPDSKVASASVQTKSKDPVTVKTLAETLAKSMPGVVSLTEKQSPQDTARTILKHVENGLNQLRAQGAVPERLEQRLQAARDGIEKGYSQATDMLKGMGLLDDELKGEIAAGRQLVEDGLNQLAERIRDPESAVVLPSRIDSLKVANQMSLQVLTREGDRVTVSFSQSEQASSSVQGDSVLQQFSAQRSWNMEVTGSLSEAEKSALTGLFDDVQSLSERFFAGDLGAALEGAMKLNIDGSQLASMSLNLMQQATVTSTRAYSQWQPQLPTPELENLKAPLASYVDSYMRALEKASPLADAPATLNDLVRELLPEESRMPVWQWFHDGINKLLEARQPAGMS